MRRQDWPEILAAKLEEMETRNFAWGEHDCGLAVCEIIEAMTGVPVGAEHRGMYHDSRSAFRHLRRVTDRGTTLGEWANCIARRHGWEPISPCRALRGDAVLAVRPEGLGIIDTAGYPRFVGIRGLVRRPLSDCARAWRID